MMGKPMGQSGKGGYPPEAYLRRPQAEKGKGKTGQKGDEIPANGAQKGKKGAGGEEEEEEDEEEEEEEEKDEHEQKDEEQKAEEDQEEE